MAFVADVPAMSRPTTNPTDKPSTQPSTFAHPAIIANKKEFTIAMIIEPVITLPIEGRSSCFNPFNVCQVFQNTFGEYQMEPRMQIAIPLTITATKLIASKDKSILFPPKILGL